MVYEQFEDDEDLRVDMADGAAGDEPAAETTGQGDRGDAESGDSPAGDNTAGDNTSGVSAAAESSIAGDSSSNDSFSFADMGLGDEVLAQLESLGYEEPTPIQQKSIPAILVGRDLIGQARTGTGKTAAFALPIIEAVTDAGSNRLPLAIVLTPTRELAIQVSEAVHRYGSSSGVRVVPIYGGQNIGRQISTLRRGVDVVVATPGRALDHIQRGSLSLEGIEIVVLDEADEMLDMGFSEDIETILDQVPEDRQTVLFSATMPTRILKMAKRHLSDPVRILIDKGPDAKAAVSTVEQRSYLVAREHKAAALGRILDVESPTAAIVFCRTRHEVDSLTESLGARGYRAEALHGGMSQEQRDRVMSRLRSGVAELLVATDVAARGLDIDHLTHVFNFDVPTDSQTYVHRIGRTGRAGRAGIAITLTEPRQRRQLRTIESDTRFTITQHPVPSVSELRNRRLALLADEIRAAAESDELAAYEDVIESLGDDFDLRQVALAALHLAHDASSRTYDTEEIPAVASKPERKRASHRADGPGPNRSRRGFDQGRGERPGKGGPRRSGNAHMTRLYVGAGSQARIRPGDLVGAIANETGLDGRDIGSIEIRGNFSLVEVPDRAASDVIAALNRTTLKGRRVKVRRDRF